MKPSVLLADEPTGKLDPHSRAQGLDLIDGLNERTTVIVATRDPSVARRAHRALVMTAGKIARRLASHELDELFDMFEAPS